MKIILIFVMLNIYTEFQSKNFNSPKTIVISLNRVNIKPIVVGDNYFMGKKTCGIYKITSPNKKIYIGQSRNVEHRLSHYRSCSCKGQQKIYNSIKKYGWNKHKFEILQECIVENLDELECYYIELYQCFDSKYGLNLHSGGKNHKKSSETKIKLSLANKGRVSYNKGKPMSEEQKVKISIANKGRIMSEEWKSKVRVANLGKKINESTRKKMSLAQKGRTFSEESKQKLRTSNVGKVQNNKAHKLNPQKAQEIRKLYATGLYKQIDIANMFNVSRPVISNVTRNKGIIWKNGI